MSESNGPNSEDKKTRVKHQTKRDSVLMTTLATSRHIANSRWDGYHQQGGGILQRQCACGVHTIGGGECNACRRKREASILQQTAPNTASDNVALNISTEVQLFPKLNFARDFSQVPVRTGNSIETQATQLNDFHIMNSRITQNRLLQRQNMCPGGVYDESERTCRPYDERDRRQCSTVYVWGPEGGNVGHASIDIDGTYASFWPDSVSYSAQDGFLDLLPGVSTPSTTHTFSDDVAAEGKAPDHAVQICCLDINAMRAKWARLRSEAFELFTNNCSTTVGRILYAGLATDPDMDAQIDAEFPQPGTNCLGSGGDLPGIDEPLDVKNAAECLRDHNCAQTR